jgi:hypothetical protein
MGHRRRLESIEMGIYEKHYETEDDEFTIRFFDEAVMLQ